MKKFHDSNIGHKENRTNTGDIMQEKAGSPSHNTTGLYHPANENMDTLACTVSQKLFYFMKFF